MLWKKFNSFVILDDLLDTGGTVNCVSRLVQDQGKEISCLITLVELKELKGKLILGLSIHSIISLWEGKSERN